MTENRCDAPCTWPTHYYDTPGDLECTVTPSTCSQNAQTFWSKKRLDYVETQYYDPSTSAWVSVARYDLAYSFPTPPTDPQGDTSERKLWLASITHRLADGSGGLPAVSYDYTMLANRASFSAAGISPLYMPRIHQIETELGGVVSFTYGQSHACNTGSSNHVRRTDDCFYHWFVNGGSSGWVLWNRWKVVQMSQSDSFSANPTQVYTYTYSSPVSHYSNDPALPDWTGSCPSLLSTCAKRTWNDFRGSEIVTVTDSSGAKTEYRFHRGMNGDRNTTSGGTYSASITLSDSSTRSDENWLSGQIVEVRSALGAPASGSVAKQRTVHWFTAALTAGSGIWGAYFVGVQKQEQTVIDTTSKTTRTEYVYDSYGNVTQEILHGDTSTTADDRLVERGYLYNTSAHIVDRPLWEKLWAGTTPGGSGGAITTTCTTYPSSDVPKTIPSSGTPTIYSDLTISATGTISDVDVLGLNGTHTWINDLEFSLTSPAATTAVIMARSCSSQDNFNLNLDDEAAPGAWPCPPVGGGTYRPSNPLSAFDGQGPNGTWRLTVKDYVTNDGGSLNGWGLRLCTNTQGPPAPTGNEKAFTVYAYDNGAVGDAPSKGNVTLVRRYSQVTPSAAYVDTTTSYDSYGRPVSVTDANNHTTTTAYHSFYGSVTSVTNPLNQVTSYVHDPGWGVVTQVTDPNNHITELAYDGYGRLEQVWLPTEDKASDPASLAFVYDAAARPAWVKTRTLQVKGSSTYLESWQYVDGFGRTLQTQTPTATGAGAPGARIVTSQQYDNLGQLRYQSAPYQLAGAAGSGYSAPTWSTVANYHQFYYDELGRQTRDETRSQNTVLWDVETTYDAWTQQRYDANNHRRDHAYNAFGQLVQVQEYYATNSFYTTSYAYDLLGNLTQVTDHLSNVTSMSYGLLGRKTAMTDSDMGSWQYQYDAVGNLTGQRDGRSQWLYLEYDALNRLIRKRRDSAGSGPLVAEYGYDATGQQGLLSFSKAYDSAGTTVEVEVQSVAYDARNRLTQQQRVVNGSGTFRLDYTYNEADQRTSLTYPGGTAGQQGEVVSHSYNAIGQLTGVSESGVQYVSAASYNAQGQLIELRNDSSANGLTRQFVYETNTLRLSTIQAGTSSPYENLQQLSYAYDNAGNLTSLTDTLNSSQKQCFQYDWLDRLTAAFTGNAGCTAYSGTGTGPYNHTYAYDAIGNITSYAGNSYTYGSGKPHAAPKGHPAAFGNSYGYDANGNQTSRTISGVTYTFTFDYENRLTSISGGSVSASFVYDANGNRVKGTVGGVTTVYIAGIYEYQAGATTHYYEGNALRRTGYASNNGVFYLLQDHLKSSSAVINQNGTLNSQNYY